MSEQTPNSVDPRVNLARHRTSMTIYRTQFALDRTTLAWVRTALTMGSFGFGMVAFFRSMLEQSRS
jgi:putative membrane protein